MRELYSPVFEFSTDILQTTIVIPPLVPPNSILPFEHKLMECSTNLNFFAKKELWST